MFAQICQQPAGVKCKEKFIPEVNAHAGVFLFIHATTIGQHGDDWQVVRVSVDFFRKFGKTEIKPYCSF
jgi:hypothetical protein